MGCNRPGKKVDGEEEFALHSAGHVPNFSMFLISQNF